MQHSATEGSSQWSCGPNVIFRQLDNDAVRDYVIASAVVCKEEDC